MTNNGREKEANWVDGDEPITTPSESLPPPISYLQPAALVMVETAFLASAASLLWLINYYFPFGPILRIFFPIPIALLYLRRGDRAAWMAALISGLLLSVLMGPPRSILYVIPFGLLGVQLGFVWQRQGSWYFGILTGTILGTFGFLFRFWLLSILLGDNLWLYVINQITVWLDWLFIRLGFLAQPDLILVQLVAVGVIIINNIIYLFTVHLVALILFDRLGNRIPRPPKWVQVLFEYDY